MASSDNKVSYTDTHGAFPGFVSISREEGGVLRLTVRARSANGLTPGPAVTLDLPQSAFRRLFNEAKDKFRG